MAVPTKTGALRNTTGGAFTSQTVGGVVIGNSNTDGAITKSFDLLDAVTLNAESIADTLPRETTTSIYTTKKPYSAGTFAYNAAEANKWIIAKQSETISGVSNTKILFMGEASLKKHIYEYQHDTGVKMLNAWVNQRFAWTGKLNDGTSVQSRTLWLSSSGHAVQKPSTLGSTYMWDISDGNASDKAVDDAASPTRAIPGELVMKVDFVTVGLSGGDHFDYKPITGV